MKKNLKFLLVIFCLFVAISVQAQIKFGPKIGLNLSTMTLKQSGISYDSKTRAGLHLGLIGEMPLQNNFNIQTGFFFSMKGSKFSGSSSDLTISPNYLEIPVNALYKYELGSAKLLLFAGPYFAYGIGGKIKVNSESEDIKFGSGDNNNMKAFDMGLNFGAGIEISDFQITAQYGLGLANLASVTTNDEKMKNRVFGISIAYLMAATTK